MFDVFAAAAHKKKGVQAAPQSKPWEKYVFIGAFALATASVTALAHEDKIKNFMGQVQSGFNRLNPF
jgi:hypothetical protein